mmetsp:Transcript_22605/g.34145  ORF Transcript_22605/g.34145 Transcript_22605/m.34145 type:complete len:281 (-) Transcript_22605:3281-4123(-)
MVNLIPYLRLFTLSYLLVQGEAFWSTPKYNQVRVGWTPVFSTATHCEISDSLRSALKKPSKNLAVVLDFDGEEQSSSDISTLSMQLRKLKASALATSDLGVAKDFVKEQASAQGNFPGPCPIIYTGEDVHGAAEAGVSAIVTYDCSINGVDVIQKVESPEQVEMAFSNAFLVESSMEKLDEILAAIPSGSVVIVSVKAMQKDNNELEEAKELKLKGTTAILFEKACVGDGEDLEYSSFVVEGLTKKKSSTFNMSGLTGSTNGHFGGVATSTSTSWRRNKN